MQILIIKEIEKKLMLIDMVLKSLNFMKVILGNLPLHIYLAKTNMIKTLLHIAL